MRKPTLPLILAVLLAAVFGLAWQTQSPRHALAQAATATPLPSTPAALPTATDDWERIKASGRLIVGTSADYPPFAFYTSDFAMDGLDVALAAQIGQKLGLEVQMRDFAFDGLLNALDLQQIDVAIAALSITPARSEVVAFTRPYYVGEDALVSAPGANIAPIRTPRALAQYRIGAQKGSVYATWLQTTLLDTGLLPADKLTLYRDITLGVADLQDGLVDLLMIDAAPARRLVDEGKGEIITSGLSRQQYAAAVRPTSTTLLAKIDEALEDLEEQGRIAQLVETYMGLPPEDQPTPVPTATPLPPTPTPTATSTQRPNVPTATATPAPCVDGMQYVADLSYDDFGMTAPPVMRPGQQFIKSWRLRNSGNCPWQRGFALVYAGGNVPAARMGGEPVVIYNSVPAGANVDLNLPLTAPTFPGVYQGFWQMVNNAGVPFGQRIWVGIQVPGAPTPTPMPPAQPSISFWADRTTINRGEPATLYWDVQNVRAVYLYEVGDSWQNNGVVGQGSRQVWPATATTYELRVLLLDGSTERRQITITVIQPQPTATPLPPARPTTLPALLPPTIDSFYANAGEVSLGGCVTFYWDVSGGATNIQLTRNGAVLVENASLRQYTDCPERPGAYDYWLIVSNESGSNRASLSLTVIGPQPR